MRAFGFGFALVAMLLLLVVDAQNGVISASCSTEKIPTGGDFITTVNSLLVTLEISTAWHGYSYKTSFPGTTTAYGEATCSPTIDYSICNICLAEASRAIWPMCDYAVGAYLNYGDQCSLRYEQYSF